MNVLPSMSEHSDLLQILTVGLIGIVGWMLKRWDTAHAKALSAVVEEMRILSDQVKQLSHEFYMLKGEHNAHHFPRRREDPLFDDKGFKTAHIHERDIE